MVRTGRQITLLCLILVFWAGTVMASEPEQTESVPEIQIEEPTYDFKKVSQGETVRHDFEVRNLGTAPLEIKGVKPG